jgi:hypothetical protein
MPKPPPQQPQWSPTVVVGFARDATNSMVGVARDAITALARMAYRVIFWLVLQAIAFGTFVFVVVVMAITMPRILAIGLMPRRLRKPVWLPANWTYPFTLLLARLIGSSARQGLVLSLWLLKRALARLPEEHRDRYEQEWLGELESLAKQHQPPLGFAFGVLVTARRTGRELHDPQPARSPRLLARIRGGATTQLHQRRKSICLGLLTGGGTVAGLTIGSFGRDGKPLTIAQVALALLSSTLLGSAVTWQAWPRSKRCRQPRR